MKILVTGANGLCGQKLSAVLLKDESVEPVLTSRGKLSIPQGRAVFESLDISDSQAVTKVFSKHKPDVVVNTAAMTLVDDCENQQEKCWHANVTSVQHLIDGCRDVNARLVHISTDFIFDGSNGPLDEYATPNPVNFYGKSKLAGEELIRGSDIHWCILRTVLVYGITHDMSRSNIVLWVKENLEKGKSIRVVNDQWRTPTLAEDLAMGCYLAAVKKAKGVYNISGKDFITPYDIAIQTARFFKLDESLISPTDSTQFTQTANRPLKTGFNIDKARKELGYEPHAFSQGLEILSKQIYAHVL